MSFDPTVSQTHITFETAAQHASVRVPVFAANCLANEALHRLRGERYDCASHIIVCDDGIFLGVVRIEDLLSAPTDTPLGDLMDRDAPVVGAGVDQEVAAWHAVRNQESALTVVRGDGRFVGVIPPDKLLAVLLSEHEEDLSRTGGFTKSINLARTSSEEAVDRRFRHRVPWLLVGLGGALFAADLVGWFEAKLEHKLILTFFIPSIVYLADAVGTQTETVIVRGLSIGIGMRRMVVRELLTGLAIGLALACVAAPVIWWRWGEADVALCVGFAVFAACSTATVAAMVLPWLLNTIGFDPAFGSGPLATVIQDLLSIFIYLAIATALVG